MERGKSIQIRKLSEHREFVEAVALQKTIWGFAEVDLLPVRLFVVASKIGGHTFGAFDGDRMVAFCLAIPGLKPGGETYLHSHMLGVLDGYRDLGLGRKLKLTQREDAIANGVQLIEWTFDPLELKNAFFNIERLGAVIRRFVFNQYGATSSLLQASLPTDRATAEWYLSGPRVEATLSGEQFARPEIVERVAVPANIGEIKAQNPAQAREIQAAVSGRLDTLLSSGLAVAGFERSAESGIYLLTPWESYQQHVLPA